MRISCERSWRRPHNPSFGSVLKGRCTRTKPGTSVSLLSKMTCPAGAAARFVVSGTESSCAASDLSSPASDLVAPALDAPPSAAAEKTE
jgi:hypothetical protein